MILWGVGEGEMGGLLFHHRGGVGLGRSRKFSGFLFRFIDHEFSASDHMAPQPEVIQDASYEKHIYPQKKDV